MKQPIKIIAVSNLENKKSEHVRVNELDLVTVKFDSDISVLYGRCLHGGALMADDHLEGHNLICVVHGWDYRYDTRISEYNNNEDLSTFDYEMYKLTGINYAGVK